MAVLLALFAISLVHSYLLQHPPESIVPATPTANDPNSTTISELKAAVAPQEAIAAGAAPEASGPRPEVGDEVVLTEAASISFAWQLQHGQVGTLVKDDRSTVPFKVRNSKAASSSKCGPHGDTNWQLEGSKLHRKAADVAPQEAIAAGAAPEASGPRPEVGDQVVLTEGMRVMFPWGLQHGEAGTLLKDDGGRVPFKVLHSDGNTHWFHEDSIKLHRKAADVAPQEAIAVGAAPEASGPRPEVGDQVVSALGAERYDTRNAWELQPGEVGTLVEDDRSCAPFKVMRQNGDTSWLREGSIKLHCNAGDVVAPQQDAEATDPETEAVIIATEESKSETVSASAAHKSYSSKYYNPLPNTSDQRLRVGVSEQSEDWVVVDRSADSASTGEGSE